MTENPSQLFWDESPDALICVSPEGVVLAWNCGAREIFGYTADEAVGHGIFELLVPDEAADEERRNLAGAMQGGLAARGALRRRKDGSLVFVDISCKAIRDEDGGMTRILYSKKDVTRLKALRDARLLEAKFHDLLESMPDAIVMANVTGRIVLANSQAEKAFGYGKGELLAQPVEILLPNRFRGAHVGHRSKYFGQPRTRSMGAGLELYGRRKDGEEFPVEISLSPIETEEGTMAMSAIRDVTERKRVEQELKEASRLKSEFLANMSHELRTPLNGIIGFSEFLVDEKPGAVNTKQREYLNDILNSGRHLLQLINDVLDLSKVEAGKMELLPETFSVSRAVHELCAAISPQAKGKNITVQASTSPAVENVTLDPQKFKQVLYNLLSNAVKFTDDGGSIEVTTMPCDPSQLRLQVRDSGIGIKREDLEKLFVEFQQLDSSASRRHQGTGLGLALSKKIIELQRGTITVESEPGKGSTFTVLLPLRNGNGAA
jgi:PAS domain S-box-containing protein